MAVPATWARLLHEGCRASGTPGAVLGVWHDGVRTVAPYGVLNTRTAVPTTEDSLFQIGSITKTWTATMIAQLVEEGRLSLAASIADVLPGIRLGEPDVADQVTIEHLLTHASGLDGDVFTDTGRGDDAVARYVEHLRDVDLVHPVGAAYSYCNTGFVLLGRVIEVLDGCTWDTAMRRRIADPWRLPQVCTLPEEAIVHRVAAGHLDGVVAEPWGLPRALGAAGLVTTGADALLGFGRHWLGSDVPEHLRAMGDPRRQVPAGEGIESIGLTWRLAAWGEHRVLGHSGGTNGQTAQLRVVPDLDLVVCLLTNSGSVDAVLDAVLPTLVRDLTGVEVPGRPQPDPSASPADLERHVGVYERRAARLEVSHDAEGLVVRIVPTGEVLVGPPETVRLHPVDDVGEQLVGRSGPNDPWVPFTFSTLPDGRAQLFFSSRAAPRVG